MQARFTCLSRSAGPSLDGAARLLATLALLVPLGCSSGPAAPSSASAATSSSTGGNGGAGGAGGAGVGGGQGGSGGAAPHPLTFSPGLVFRSQLRQPGNNAHLGELAVHQGLVYAANSFDSITVHRPEADGSLSLAFEIPPDVPRPRCTTIAIHEASSTLFCGSERSHAVATFDLADPAQPVLREAEAITANDLYARDLHVDGDTLYIARFEQGLWSAKIAPDGSLSGLASAGIQGDARFIEGAGGRLVLVTADRGLGTLTAGPGGLVEDGILALPGPAQQLVAHDDRAAVSLGSGGVLLVDVHAAPSVIAALTPPGVVTGADFQGDALAATTLAGVFAYDLSDHPPRVAGFGATSSVMLDVRFVGSDIVTSDFWYSERFALDPTGNLTNLDMPRGVYFVPGHDVVVPFRNAGKLPLRLQVELGGDTLGDVMVAPGETFRLTVPAATASAQVGPGGWIALLVARTLRPSSQAALDDPLSSAWKEWDARFIALAARPSDADPAAGRPAPSDPFPVITLADIANNVFTVPLAGKRQRIIFYSKECVAMWPELEDAAWLAKTNRLDDGAVPVFLNKESVSYDEFAARWGLEGSVTGYYGPTSPAAVKDANAQWGTETYDAGFYVGQIPSGADHPTDYVVDATGTVEAVERVYYGAWPLR